MCCLKICRFLMKLWHMFVCWDWLKIQSLHKYFLYEHWDSSAFKVYYKTRQQINPHSKIMTIWIPYVRWFSDQYWREGERFVIISSSCSFLGVMPKKVIGCSNLLVYFPPNRTNLSLLDQKVIGWIPSFRLPLEQDWRLYIEIMKKYILNSDLESKKQR